MARGQLITLAQGAKRSTLNQKTLRRYVAQGILTGYRVGPKLLRLDADEVDALVKTVQTTGGDAA